MICNNCGYVNPDNNKYCANCGKKFTRIQSELTDMNPEKGEIKEEITKKERYHKESTADKIRNTPTSYKLLACGLLIILLILIGFATPGHNNTIPLINDTPNNNNTNAFNDTDNTTKAIKSHINVTANNNNPKVGDKVDITGYLTDENNKHLIDCEISVNIDGSEYKTHTDTDGYYKVEYNNITAGEHNIKAIYAGDENIEGSQNTTSLHVEYKKSNITLEIEDKLKEDNKIIAKGVLKDEQNTPISKAQIKITTANSQQNVTTADDGTYSLEITDLEHKTQNITAQYDGDENTQASQATIEIKLEKEKTKITATVDQKSDEKIVINGTLKNNENKPVDNVPVKLKSDNQEDSTKTNDKGEFTIETTDTNTTKITLSYDGNDTTESTQETFKIEKDKINTTIDIKTEGNPIDGEPLRLTGTLKDEDNHPLEKATIKIKYGEDEYTTITDENGRYNISISNITSQNSDVTVLYEGNETYNQCHDKITILIESDDLNNTVNKTKTEENTSHYH